MKIAVYRTSLPLSSIPIEIPIHVYSILINVYITAHDTEVYRLNV